MAVLKIILDKRKSSSKVDKKKPSEKGNGVYPVKLRVSHGNDKRYYGIENSRINPFLTGQLDKFINTEGSYFSINETYFEDMLKAKGGHLKALQNIFNTIQLKYQAEADKIVPFNFDKFAEVFRNKGSIQKNDLYIMVENHVADLQSENRYNTATTFENTIKSIKAFSGKNKLPFESVTPTFLKKYKDWMLQNSKSLTTVGIYMRTLRVIINKAISSGITKNYPFATKDNDQGFNIPEPTGRKLALSQVDLKTLFSYETNNKDTGQFYVDSWKLLYLMQGINPKDLCLLKYRDMKHGVIKFTRAKTERRKAVEIEIPVSERIQELLTKWGNPLSADEYIWPVLTTSDPAKQTKQIAQFVKLVNKYIGRVALENEIYADVTCYVARHSYATQLMRHGAPVAFISKALGHTKTATTDVYLSSFEIDQKREWQKKTENL